MSEPKIFTESVAIAMIDLVGTVIGSVATVTGNIVMSSIKEYRAAKKINLLNNKGIIWLEYQRKIIGTDQKKQYVKT